MGFWSKQRDRVERERQKVERRPASIIAAATLVSQAQFRSIPDQQDWQTRLWEYYDVVPEFRFCVDWRASAASRCSLYIGEIPEDGTGTPTPTEDEDARAPLEEFGGAGAVAEIISRMVTQLAVPGETYVVGLDVPLPEPLGGTRRRWLVASGAEFTRNGSRVSVKLPETGQDVELDPQTTAVIRVWRRHPKIAWNANSASRAVLPLLKRIVDLDSHVTAATESRLAGAGILEISEEATLPTTDVEEGDVPIHEDPSMATLIEAMVTPITDRDSASAVVPIILRSPTAAMGKARHITFTTPLDAQIQPLQDGAIRRLALGMDSPPEVLLGLGASNHWNAEQISVDGVVIHIEPDLVMICEALTQDILRPALIAQGHADPERFVFWYDTSELTQKPDRGPVALELWKEGLLSDDACLRECGFAPEDRPEEAEATRRLLVKLATAGVDPAVVGPYLAILAGGQVAGTALPTAQPAIGPALPPIDAVSLPAAAGALTRQEWQIRTVELGVLYALERVGRRILGDPGGRALRGRDDAGPVWSMHAHPQVKTFDASRALDGAYAVLDVVLGDQPTVRRAVAEYVAALLEAREPHRRDYLLAVLQRAGCLEPEDLVVGDAA